MKFLKSLMLSLLLASSFVAFAGAPVNVNTADAATLAAAMNGVGLAKAEAIVAYRKQHGAFRTLDQLADVKGIGLKTIEKNRGLINVGGGGVRAPAKPATKPVAAR